MDRPRPTSRTPLVVLLAMAALATLASPAAAAEGGLEIFPDWFRTLPLLVAFFVVLIWPTNALLWKPLLRVLDQRAERIEGTRERGTRIGAEADEVFARYQAAVERARTAAEVDTRAQLDHARREQGRVTSEARRSAEEQMSAARAEMEGELDAARAELRSHVEDLARVVASRALGRELA